MAAFTAISDQVLVNTSTANNQFAGQITALSNGRYVSVWTDNVLATGSSLVRNANADIRGQIFNADGTKFGSEFLVNTTIAAAQFVPTVTTLADGNFIVGWQDNVGTILGGTGAPIATIRAQEFTASGVAVGSEFQIGAGVEAFRPDFTPLAGGGFAAVWQTWPGGAIVGQVFDASNTATGSQFTIDDTNVVGFTGAIVRTLADGNLVVGYRNGNNDAGIATVSTYTTAGVLLNSQALGPTADQFNAGLLHDIAVLPGGGFVAAFQVNQLAGSGFSFVNLAYFDAAGDLSYDADVTEHPLNLPQSVRLTTLPNGGIIASFVGNDTGFTGEDPVVGDGSGSTALFSYYNPSGARAGDPVRINNELTGDQIIAGAALLTNGNIAFTWINRSGSTGDTDGTSITSRVFTVDLTNTAPVANDGTVRISGSPTNGGYVVDPDSVDFVSDADGDVLTLTAVTNAANGTAVLQADGSLLLTPAAGATAPLSFDYTISDGNGGTDTARATIVFPDDAVTVRGLAPVTIDVFTNDYLAAIPGEYTFLYPQGDQSYGISGYFANGSFVNSQSTGQPGLNSATPPPLVFLPSTTNPQYLNLLVGQTLQTSIQYGVSDQATGLLYYATVNLTLEGWAQIGGTGADTLTGTNLADHLIGGDGAANTLTGLGGDDRYTVTAVGDIVVEEASAGFDSVITNLANFTLADNVEQLFFNGNASLFSGTGNAENNRINGGFVQNVTLFGLAGNDVLQSNSVLSSTLYGGDGDDRLLASGSGTNDIFGEAGNDTLQVSFGPTVTRLYGGSGDDTYIITGTAGFGGSPTIVELAGEGNDTISITNSVNLNDYANIENATLGTLNGGGDFAVYGTAVANVINGNAGANVIYGFGDNDTLNGDGGNDTLFGGDGDDAINGGAGTDTIYAGTGANTLAGGADRDDYYDVDADDIVNELAGGGYDVVFASGNVVLGANSEVELVVTGAATTSVMGSITANYIVGNALNNDFRGGGGNDYLVGNAGVDALDGGDGDDILLGGEDRDYLYGGAGVDYFEGNGGDDYLEGGADRDDYYWIEAGDTIVEIVGGGYDVIWAIGNVTLGETSDVELIVTVGPATAITGSNTANYIAGNASAAAYNGLGGDDTILAGGGNDGLLGGAGADGLFGEDGNDILEGGAGQDYLSGGSGADIFRISDAGNFDQLVDFQSGVDQIALSNAAFSHTAAINFISGAGEQSATNGNSTFLHDTTTGYVQYDADGNGAGAAVYILLASGASFAASDFVFY